MRSSNHLICYNFHPQPNCNVCKRKNYTYDIINFLKKKKKVMELNILAIRGLLLTTLSAITNCSIDKIFGLMKPIAPFFFPLFRSWWGQQLSPKKHQQVLRVLDDPKSSSPSLQTCIDVLVMLATQRRMYVLKQRVFKRENNATFFFLLNYFIMAFVCKVLQGLDGWKLWIRW